MPNSSLRAYRWIRSTSIRLHLLFLIRMARVLSVRPARASQPTRQQVVRARLHVSETRPPVPSRCRSCAAANKLGVLLNEDFNQSYADDDLAYMLQVSLARKCSVVVSAYTRVLARPWATCGITETQTFLQKCPRSNSAAATQAPLWTSSLLRARCTRAWPTRGTTSRLATPLTSSRTPVARAS